MARNKIKIEKLEAIVARSPEQPPPPRFTEYVQSLIQDGLAHANPQNRETRSLSEIESDTENDKNKSRARKDFEIHIACMAHRMKLKPVLTVSDNASQPEQASDSELLPLHERIKFLRERVND